MRPSLCVFDFAASKFKSSFANTCARRLPQTSHLSPSLPRGSRHIAGSCGCRCGRGAKDGDSFLCCQRALTHPVLWLPLLALPATSCIGLLDCQKWEQTSAPFTANVALYRKKKNIYCKQIYPSSVSQVTETRTGPLGCSNYDSLDSVSSVLVHSPENKIHLKGKTG